MSLYSSGETLPHDCPIPTHLKSLEFVYAHARGTNCLKLCGECFQEMEDVLLWCNCCRPWWCKLKPNAYAISSFFRILLPEKKEKTFSLYCHQLPQQDKQDRCTKPERRTRISQRHQTSYHFEHDTLQVLTS